MKCPKCGNEDIQINEAWDKTIDLPRKYIAIFICVSIVLIIVTIALFDVNIIAFIVGLVITMGFVGGGTNWYVQWKKQQKKKSHSKCICKKCGHTWYID